MWLSLTEIAVAGQTEEAFHRAEAWLDPEAESGDPLVEPLLGGVQRAVSCGLAQDHVAMLAAQLLAIGLAGIGFVSQPGRSLSPLIIPTNSGL